MCVYACVRACGMHLHVGHVCICQPAIHSSLRSPLPNVSVAPLPSNFLEWHGNIRAPEDTLYKGAIFHFAIHFSEQHPL